MTERITSRRNPLLEQVRRLDTAALRRKAGVFLCDSPKLVGEAVQHGVSVQCVIAADGVAFPEGLPENVRRGAAVSFKTLKHPTEKNCVACAGVVIFQLYI